MVRSHRPVVGWLSADKGVVMWFWIGIVAAVLVGLIGWVGVQRTGSYENRWGVLMVWAVPVYCVAYTLISLFI